MTWTAPIAVETPVALEATAYVSGTTEPMCEAGSDDCAGGSGRASEAAPE